VPKYAEDCSTDHVESATLEFREDKAPSIVQQGFLGVRDMSLPTFRTPSLGYSSLRGARGGGGRFASCLASGLESGLGSGLGLPLYG
jgi:hypothetical protein